MDIIDENVQIVILADRMPLMGSSKRQRRFVTMGDPRTDALREMAEHRGLRLLRSRRRKPGGDFGRYGLVDRQSGRNVLGVGKSGLKATADQVETFLRERESADWTGSLQGLREARPPRSEKSIDRSPATARQKGRLRRPPARPAVVSAPAPPVTPEAVPALTIRPARKGDAPSIAALLQELNDSEAGDLAARIAGASRRKVPVLVAELGGLVGLVAYELVDIFHRAAPLGRISTLIVNKRARRQGVGSALLRAAEERLVRLGCTKFEGVGEIQVGGPQSFFRDLGYEKAYRYVKRSGDQGH